MSHNLQFILMLASCAGVAIVAIIALVLPWLKSLQRQIAHLREMVLLSRLHDLTALQNLHSHLLENKGPANAVPLVQLTAIGKNVSVMESEGKRFLKVEGEISDHERHRLVQYLQSEGFLD